MPKSVYIHIPFCKSKCKYCSFISFATLDLIPAYINSLIQEINTLYKGEKIKTLYLGGGTPSLLDLNYIERIIKIFNFDSEYELTLELNPDDVNYNYLYGLKNLGVNRLSIGSQTFNNKILKFIGRRHDSKSIIKSVEFAKKCDFNNLSLDLIYGLPYQNIKTLKFDLKEFLKLDIQHISTYGLKVENNSYWGNFFDYENYQLKFKDSTVKIPDNDIQAEMYEFINEILSENKFYRYEISNFSKKGFESKHNLNYWLDNFYLGIGAGAHGYINNVRYKVSSNLLLYLNGERKIEEEVIDEKLHKEEFIMLGLRLKKGLSLIKYESIFKVNFLEEFSKIIDILVKERLIKIDKNYLKCTKKGFIIQDQIIVKFFEYI